MSEIIQVLIPPTFYQQFLFNTEEVSLALFLYLQFGLIFIWDYKEGRIKDFVTTVFKQKIRPKSVRMVEGACKI